MVEKWRVRSRGSCTTPRLHNLVEDFTATNLSTACFPLPEKPKSCWAREHISPVKIDRRSWTSPERSYNITRPYYICTTCDNGKYNVFRDNGYCGSPSRQDGKGGKAPTKFIKHGFWVCASGACDYVSYKDGVPYEDAKATYIVILKIPTEACFSEVSVRIMLIQPPSSGVLE